MFSVCPSVKMSAADLDQAFREAVTSNGPDGGWTIKNDERVKYVGKLEVSKGEDTSLKVTMEDYPEAGMSALKYYTIREHLAAHLRLNRTALLRAASWPIADALPFEHSLLTPLRACGCAESYTK
jgi:hypothetical protein